MITDLKQFEERSKTNLANTMGKKSRVHLGIEELGRAVSGNKKPGIKGESLAKNQISMELDKYESAKIEKYRRK